MKKTLPAWLILTLIAAVAGVLLGFTNGVTKPVIEANALKASDAERYAVYAEADSFRVVELSENAAVDACFEAVKGNEVVGHVAKITVKGYGGDIEILVGLTNDNVITGISVGGANFAETAGLGARTKDPEFTGQFSGITAPAALGENVDSIAGASISSGAVVSGVNKAVKYINNIGNEEEQGLFYGVVPGAVTSTELPHDDTVDAAYKVEGGYVVLVSVTGFHGPIHVYVGLDEAGVVTGVAIDENDFNETAGLGERVLEPAYLAQYIGLTGIIGVNPGEADATASATGTADAASAATGETVDATSSATGESDEADDDKDDKDDDHDDKDDGHGDKDGDHADAAASATAVTASADATTAATGENASSATAAATSPDAAGADAASSASTVVETIDGAGAWIDGVSGATISSTAVTKAVNAAIAFVLSLLS